MKHSIWIAVGIIMFAAVPAHAKSVLFVCNDAQFIDKRTKSKPKRANISASVTVDLEARTAELLLGSKSIKTIGTRSNKGMKTSVDKEGGDKVLVGATSDEVIYFTLNPKRKTLLASYADLMVKFGKCVNMAR
jgi:hypothetical protein